MARRRLALQVFFLLLLGFAGPGGPGREAAPPEASKVQARLAAGYGRIPLHFEENRGQAPGEVRFLSRGPGYALYLTPGEAVLALHRPLASRESRQASDAPAARTSDILRLKLLGSNPTPQMTGRNLLPAKSHYLTGNDPSRWRRDVPNWAKVEYSQVYPGIDLLFYGNQRRFEYDFVVAPGANPGVIRLRFEGAEKIALDKSGNLVLKTPGGEVVQQAPIIYQESDGARREVAGGYILRGEEVGFRVGSYDKSKALVIDPTIAYATYLGAAGVSCGGCSGDDTLLAVAVDSSGNAYVTGYTRTPNFPTANPMDGTFNGAAGTSDVVVAKLNAAGSALDYSTYLGGSGDEQGNAIAVDSSGNAYVTGWTSSSDFPTTVGAFDTSRNGSRVAFVAKLNAAGSALVYSTYLGGSSFNYGNGIALDSSGNAYVTGETSGSDFPTTGGALDTSLGGQSDAFVTKLNSTGTALVYSTFLGGSGEDYGNGIAVDSAGNAYIAGATESGDFPTAGPYQGTYGGSHDAFVAKLNAAGSALVYSTYLGGSDIDIAYGIALDASSNAYVTGYTNSADFPISAGAFDVERYVPNDAFVAKLNPTGNALAYSTFLGASASEQGKAIAVDSAGNAYVTGLAGADFPTSNSMQAYGGVGDAFVTKLNPSGSALAYSTFLGGTQFDQGNGIAVDSSGNAYVVGITYSANFPTVDPFQSTLGGSGPDAFVAKISSDTPAVLTSPSSGSTLSSSATFQWSASAPASVYYLKIGSSLESEDIYEGYQGGNLSVTVSGLPADSRTLYVTLYTLIDDVWVKNEYTFTALDGRAQIASPAPGAALSSTSATFQWNPNTSSVYYLKIGSSAESEDIYEGYQGSGLSATVTGLPADGRTLHVTLYTLIGGRWVRDAWTYQAVDGRAQIASPAPGSMLASSSATFQWNPNMTSVYYLKIGSSAEREDIYDAYQGSSLSAAVTGLPTDGRALFATLYTLIDNTWRKNEYTLRAFATDGRAQLTSPVPGSTLTSSTATFQWSAATLSVYYLKIGSTLESEDIHEGYQGSNLQATVAGLPTDGRTLYVTLYTLVNDAWVKNQYTLKAAG